MGHSWSVPEADAVAQVAATLAGEVFAALPMFDILENKMKALSANLAAYRGDGGANEPQAVEAHQLRQRVASMRDLLKLFPADSITKDDALWRLLFHTLDKIEGVLADWGRKGKVRRALNGKSIKDGFERMDRELTTRIDDVVRRLEATEREKAAAFRKRVAEREEEGANALKELQAAAAAQQAALEGATAELRTIAAACSTVDDEDV